MASTNCSSLECGGARLVMLRLNLDRFTRKMRDPALEQLINRDYDEAKRLGVTSTPWIYINGWHPPGRSLPDLVDAIDKEVNK